MRKRALLIRATDWPLSFLYQLRRFQNRNLWYNFQTLFERKRGLPHLYFLYENESLQHCLSYDLRQIATFSVFEVQFFQQVRFLGELFFLRSRVRVRVWFLGDAITNDPHKMTTAKFFTIGIL